jgi:hypothetical protein
MMFILEPHIMIKLCFKKYVKPTYQIIIFILINHYSIKSYIEPHIIFMLNQLNQQGSNNMFCSTEFKTNQIIKRKKRPT